MRCRPTESGTGQPSEDKDVVARLAQLAVQTISNDELVCSNRDGSMPGPIRALNAVIVDSDVRPRPFVGMGSQKVHV